MNRARLAIDGGAPLINRPFPDWPRWGGREEELLREVLASGVWGGGALRAPKTAQLAAEVARMHGAARGVAVSSCTAALHLALLALEVGPGDEVIVPAYTFAATALAVLYTGATAVFVDIDPDTFCLSAEAAAGALTERTRAMIPVHFGGQPADMESLAGVARGAGAKVVEDCAHALGAAYRGRPVGTWGACGCFSFQHTKNVTCGEGGVLVSNDAALVDLCDYTLSKLGRTKDGHPHHHVRLGYKYEISEFQAAVGLAGLERAAGEMEVRLENARFLRQSLRRVPGLKVPEWAPGTDRHGCHLFMAAVDPGVVVPGRDRFVAALAAEGVPCRTLYLRPVHRQPMFLPGGGVAGGSGRWRAHPTPAAEEACRNAFYIPQRVLLADRDLLAEIPRAVDKVLGWLGGEPR